MSPNVEGGADVHYATIKNCDIANGPGVRVSLFVSGCTHHCKGCFNAVAWDFDYGQPFIGRSRSSVRYHIQQLKDAGKIQREGTTRTGKWVVL